MQSVAPRFGPLGMRYARSLAWGLFVLGGCTHQDPADRSIDKLQAEITKMQADRDRLDERLGALEASDQKRDNEAKRAPSPVTSASPGGSGAPDHPRLLVVHVGEGGILEPLPPANGEAVDVGLESGDPRPVVQASGSRLDSANHRAHGRNRVDSSTLSPEAKRDYEAALSLVRARQFAQALDALTGFLVRYPDHALVDNAMYWRGECFYAQGDYARAAEQFEGLIARFPFGNKAPDAFLKLGLCQQRLGSHELAQQTFADLQDRYPKSDAARQVPHP